MFRGGPKMSDYFSRFFSLFYVSGSFFSSGCTLIQGDYWVDNGLNSNSTGSSKLRDWPYYNTTIGVTLFHELMVYMAKLSRLSSESMSDLGREKPERIIQKAAQISEELQEFWNQCPPA